MRWTLKLVDKTVKSLTQYQSCQGDLLMCVLDRCMTFFDQLKVYQMSSGLHVETLG
jgi:hypothetical protein